MFHNERSLAVLTSIVDDNVLDGELLVSEPHGVLSTVEDEVSHVSTTAVLLPDTLVVGAGSHVEDKVDEGSSLGDLPMQTSGGRAGGGKASVELDVPDGAEATIGVG